MKFFSLLASAGLATLASLPLTMAGVITPSYFDKHPLSRRQLSDAQVQRELGPQLSRGATIIGPGGPGWDDAIERFDNESRPTIRLVVVPAVESDIATVVKLANRFGVPFLVKNRGHALTNTIGRFRGIQIDMSRLTTITIQPGEPAESAWFQGGAWDKQAIEYLWDRGYVTVTGSCDCVGMMGPGLGGGHGRYQGLYGLISDNLINMNVVLADGSAVRVNATSNPDLWWYAPLLHCSTSWTMRILCVPRLTEHETTIGVCKALATTWESSQASSPRSTLAKSIPGTTTRTRTLRTNWKRSLRLSTRFTATATAPRPS